MSDREARRQETIDELLKSAKAINKTVAEIPPEAKRSLIERLRGKDLPVLATPGAHG